MTLENRNKLAKHFAKLGNKNHPYVLEMKKTKATVLPQPVENIQTQDIPGEQTND